MKKQLNKQTVKTDKIVSLTKSQAKQVAGGIAPDKPKCATVGTSCWIRD